MKKLYRVLLVLALALLLVIGALSLILWRQPAGLSQTAAPQFSLRALFDGTFLPQLEAYYTATFPGREQLMQWNKTLGRFYYAGSGEQDNVLVLSGNTGAEQAVDDLLVINYPDMINSKAYVRWLDRLVGQDS